MTGSELLEIVNTGGSVGLLVVIVAGALRGWWVPGRTYDRVVSERDRFLELAIRAADAAKGATDVLQTQRQAAEDLAHKAALEALERAKREGMI